MAASAHPAAPSGANVVGRSVLRIEDPPLLTGKGSFVGDLSFPRQLHMRVVRSAYAHGRIVAIDSAAALAAPGVVAGSPGPLTRLLPGKFAGRDFESQSCDPANPPL